MKHFLIANPGSVNPFPSEKWYKCSLSQHLVLYSEQQLPFMEISGREIWIAGEIENLKHLKAHFNFLRCGEPLTPFSFIGLLIDYLGTQTAVSFLEGNFCLIERAGRQLNIFTDSLGKTPVYYSGNTMTCISSSVKLLSKMSGYEPILKPFDEFETDKRTENYSPFRNLERLGPDSYLSISGESLRTSKKQSINFLGASVPNNGSYFVKLLDENIEALTTKANRIGVPLSGGIDSSTVCALLKTHHKELYTYSIGTDARNEFEYSTMVANHLECVNRKKIITEEQVKPLLNNLINYNEIFDSLALEILLPFEVIYKMAVEDGVENLATGYGSDLILGGTLHNVPSPMIHNESVALIKRTFWTNEFVNTNAERYHLDIVHPFWKSGIIKYGLNINADLKIKNGTEKYIFRKLVSEKAILPESITWRKKIGIHEGSGMNTLIKSALNTTNQRDIDYYIYQMYRELILKPEQILKTN